MAKEIETVVETEEELSVDDLKVKLAAAEDAKSGIIAERQAAKKESRELRAQVATLSTQQIGGNTEVVVPAKPTELKDPMEVFAASEDYDPEQSMPAHVYLAHERYKTQKAKDDSAFITEATKKQTREQSFEVAKVTMTDDALGEGFGWEAVTSKGFALLDPDQKNVVMHGGRRAGQLFYDQCLGAIKEANPKYGVKADAASETDDKSSTEGSSSEGKPQGKVPSKAQVIGRQPKALASLGLGYGHLETE